MEEKDLKLAPNQPDVGDTVSLAATLQYKVLSDLAELASQPGATYLVTSNVTYSGSAIPYSIKIADNVTLIFQGGSLYSKLGKVI